MKKLLLILVGIGAAVFLILQVIPFGKNHVNPPVIAEPIWDIQSTRDMAVRACFDCHSNETNWPWYSNIAPVSWLVQRDVNEGRDKLNFSEWGFGEDSGDEWDEIEEEIRSGRMPMPIYIIQHPKAKLTAADKEQLIKGLLASTGQE